ncbi:MAG: hypothetical protein ACM37W_03615 [Actinomycetota bacterium]
MIPRQEIGMILGFLLTLVLHIFALVLLLVLSPYLPYFNEGYNVFFIPAFIGLWQLFYVLPLIVLFKKQERWGVMKGVIICAVLTVLLNGGCWLLFSLNR